MSIDIEFQPLRIRDIARKFRELVEELDMTQDSDSCPFVSEEEVIEYVAKRLGVSVDVEQVRRDVIHDPQFAKTYLISFQNRLAFDFSNGLPYYRIPLTILTSLIFAGSDAVKHLDTSYYLPGLNKVVLARNNRADLAHEVSHYFLHNRKSPVVQVYEIEEGLAQCMGTDVLTRERGSRVGYLQAVHYMWKGLCLRLDDVYGEKEPEVTISFLHCQLIDSNLGRLYDGERCLADSLWQSIIPTLKEREKWRFALGFARIELMEDLYGEDTYRMVFRGDFK